jgi:hypothetical protein
VCQHIEAAGRRNAAEGTKPTPTVVSIQLKLEELTALPPIL